MSMLKQISQLEKQLEKKNKQIKSQHHIELQGQKNTNNNNNNKYKKMYEQALQEIEQLKSINMKQGMNFKADFDDVQEMAHFDNSDDEQKGDGNKMNKVKKVGQNNNNNKGKDIKQSGSQISAQEQLTVDQLKKKNEQLQQNLATMSYKLAALFNASFQFGGAQLLDFLQTSIGLTEKN